MAIEFFKQQETSPNLDFLNEYLEENPKSNGKIFDIYSFTKAKSGKGYMLSTSDFHIWFFRKEKILTQILEALDYYCKTGEGLQFVCQIDKSVKSLCHIGIDEDRKVTYIPLEGTSYVLQNYIKSEGTKKEKKGSNPFLIQKKNPVPSPLTTIDSPNSGVPEPPSSPLGEKGQVTRK